MARLMLAWELGGGLGHAMPLATLTAALLTRGHDVHLAWRDLSTCRPTLGKWLDHPGLHLWQAPVCLSTFDTLPEPANWAEILFRAGYLDEGQLLGAAHAWRTLFNQIRPDFLLAEHAPSALLASRGLGMRRATFGTGFFIPPQRVPMPAFRDWEPVPAERLLASEAQALATCRAVSRGLGDEPFEHLHQLYDVDERFLMGWPELDHFAGLREGQPLHAWGILRAGSIGKEPLWPPGEGKRIFAYLSRHYPEIGAVLACLRAGPWRSFVHLSGASAQDAARLSSDRMQVTHELVDIAAGIAQADVLLSHSNTSTVQQGLSAGVPSVMLPLQAEHLLMARRVAALGAGVYLWPHDIAGLYQALSAVLGSPGFRATAEMLAVRHAPTTPDATVTAIVARIQALAGLSDSAR